MEHTIYYSDKLEMFQIITVIYVQLFMNFQPLNVCLSYQGTLNLVEKISDDHDVPVFFWRDELKQNLTKDTVVSYYT